MWVLTKSIPIFIFKNMNTYLIVTTKDSVGTSIDYIKIKEIETFTLTKDNRYIICMKSGGQFQISPKFCTIEHNQHEVKWEEVPRIICNG